MPNPNTPVGQASPMPGTEGFTMACFKASDVPAGTNLYTLAPMAADPDINLIARVFADFREEACIHGSDRVDGAFIKAARRLMGAAEKRCEYCDGTGDVHSIDGEWRGACTACKAPEAPLRISAGRRDGGWQEFDVNDHYGAIRVVARMEDESEDLPLGKLIEDFLLGAPVPVLRSALRTPPFLDVDAIARSCNGEFDESGGMNFSRKMWGFFVSEIRDLLAATGAKP